MKIRYIKYKLVSAPKSYAVSKLSGKGFIGIKWNTPKYLYTIGLTWYKYPEK